MRHLLLATTLFAISISGSANAQATITVLNNDGPNEGFNDPTPVAAVAGNAGTTLGQQRLNAFRAAAAAWESVVTSSVEITVDAAMDLLTPCTGASGVLGRAGTLQVFRDFANAPQTNTWYSSALANAISGIDNDATTADIQARFNSNIDNNDDCLAGTNWFYGIGVPTPANTISFFDTVKHELAHGLGVQSFVDIVSTGQLLQGRNDSFTNNLRDHAANTAWSAMTDAERLASSTNDGQLHWVGPRVNTCASQILTAGLGGGHVRMFAPSPVQAGSSVSHFDTALDPDELMEPFATATSDQRLTDRLLADIGWDVNSPSCGGGILHHVALSPIIVNHRPALSGTVLHRPTVSPIHFPRGSFHSVLTSPGHVPIGSRHFPTGSSHQPILSPRHQPIGSFHGPLLSPGHSPVISNPHDFVVSRFDGIDPSIPIDPRIDPQIDPRMLQFGSPGVHNPIVSFGHNPIMSGHSAILSGHNPVLSGHSPILSGHNPFLSGHNPIFSGHNPFLSGHNPFISAPHSLQKSIGHISVLSNNPHSFISSRFGELDPTLPVNPGIDPRAQQFGGARQPQNQQFGSHSAFVSFGHDMAVSGHGVQQSIGHLPFQSEMHGVFNSTGHSSFISSGHIPFTSAPHSTFLSSHNPIVSGHSLVVSGHNPIFSGHSPIASGHEPFLSAPHAPVLSRPPHSMFGSRFQPTGPVVINPAFPGVNAAPENEGIEQVPGNRGIRTMPGLPPGDPYTVPQQ